VRASQLDLLGEVEAGRVGFGHTSTGDGRYGVTNSYRLWSSEFDYTVVTARVRTLLKAELVRLVHNPSMFGRGAVELTAAGRDALNQAYPSRNAHSAVGGES
jgi:hypothetical protein